MDGRASQAGHRPPPSWRSFEGVGRARGAMARSHACSHLRCTSRFRSTGCCSGLGTVSSLHLGGSTTGLSGIGACEAIADDVVNMRSIGRFSQSFILRSPESTELPGRRPRVLTNREASRLETNTSTPHMVEATLRGPGEPRVRIPVKRFLACFFHFQ